MNTMVLVTTALLSGLSAGIIYAWTVSVTRGLALVDNKTYLTSFQAMNRAILNPAFFVPFIGLIPILTLMIYLVYGHGNSLQVYSLIAAFVFYAGGVMLVTINGNIPLNNKLDKLRIEEMSEPDMQEFRIGFEKRWNRLNMVRTVSSTITFLLLLIAVLINK